MAQKKGTQGQGLKLGQWVKMSVNGYDFYEEKSDHQIWHLVGNLSINLGTGIQTNQPLEVQMPRGECWSSNARENAVSNWSMHYLLSTEFQKVIFLFH